MKAYEGEYLSHAASLPLVVEISGELPSEASSHSQGTRAQRCLLATVFALNLVSDSRYPLLPFAQIAPSMTVCVEQLSSVDGKIGELVARLDLTREGNRVFASLLVADQPRINLEPVDVNLSDGVLDAFLRLLSFMLA